MMSILIRIAFLLYFLLTANNIFADQLIFNVGIRQFSINYPPTKSEIKGILWYPTLDKSQKIKVGPFDLDVTKNAEIKDGKYGLIVISHGSQGSHLGHRDTAVYLAKRGFIVVSVLHPKNNYLDDSAGRTVENWINRPRHISTALDSILTEGDIERYINKDAIAIIGHSAGGYTAVSLIGGVPDTANISRHCQEHIDDTELCGGHGFISRIKGIFSLSDSKDEHIIKDTHDRRIKAAVLLAPLGVLFKDEQALVNIKVPILMYRGEKDDVLRYPYHAESINQKLNIKPEYIVVENAGHYSFLSPFPDGIKQRVGVVAKDPNGFDRVEFHLQMNQKIFRFLSKSFRND